MEVDEVPNLAAVVEAMKKEAPFVEELIVRRCHDHCHSPDLISSPKYAFPRRPSRQSARFESGSVVWGVYRRNRWRRDRRGVGSGSVAAGRDRPHRHPRLAAGEDPRRGPPHPGSLP